MSRGQFRPEVIFWPVAVTSIIYHLYTGVRIAKLKPPLVLIRSVDLFGEYDLVSGYTILVWNHPSRAPKEEQHFVASLDVQWKNREKEHMLCLAVEMA